MNVVDARHVKGRSWLPCSSAGGEGEHVHEPGRGVGPLADGLDLTEEESGKSIGPPGVTVEAQRCGLHWVDGVSPEGHVRVGLEGEVEGVLVSDGVTTTAGGVVGRPDHPCEAVGGVVEVDLDLVGCGTGGGDGVNLTLGGGDQVLVFNGGECLTLIDVKVHVRDKETGVHVGGGKGGSGGGVHGDLSLGLGVEVSVDGVGVLVDNDAAVGESAESYLNLNLVVGKGDKGDDKPVLHEVLVEPSGDGHEESAVSGGELNHVLLDVSRVSELTDLLAKAGAGALGEFLPEEHPLGVEGVYFGSSDLDLDLGDHGESDGVNPVGGLVGVSHGVTGSVKDGGGSLDGGEGNLEHDVAHEVTVTADVGRHLLAETDGSGAEVVLLVVLSERGVTVVLGLKQSHVSVGIDVRVLTSDSSDLDNSSTGGHGV